MNKISIKLFVGSILGLLGLVSILLTIVSTIQFRDAALKAQSQTLTRVVEVAVDEELRVMHKMAMDMLDGVTRTSEFRKSFKSYTKDQSVEAKDELIRYLNGQFHQRYITSGLLVARQLRLYDKKLSFLVQSQEGQTGLTEKLPDFLYQLAVARKGAERLKTIGGAWGSNNGPAYSVLAPVGGLRLLGYIEIVLEPAHNLKNIEEMLKAPLLISKNEAVLYKSKDWDDVVVSDALSVKYVLQDYQKKVDLLELTALEDVSALYTSMANTQFLIITAFIIAIIVGIFSAFVVLKKYLFTPIADVMTGMNSCAKGDLTTDVKQSGLKETYVLSASLSSLVVSLREQVTSIQNDARSVSSSADDLAEISETTTQAMERQQIETEQLATSINEMAATVTEVAQSASNASDQANNANNATESGYEVVNQTISMINSLASEVEQASEVIQGLEDDSAQISSVIDVIKNIAEQTNLLALNAAIEAARAGEQGRGFAVVADEVRTLANRTQQSTEEINSMIERLQSGTRAAVEVMDKSKAEAQASVEQASLAGAALTDIQSAVQLITDMNMQIAAASEEQSTVAQGINQSVVSINDATLETSNGTKATSKNSLELKELAVNLEAITSTFKV